MFLAGLKFSLGLICGYCLLSAILIGFIALAELVTMWRNRKSKGQVHRRLIHPTGLAVSHRETRIIVLRGRDWLDRRPGASNRRNMEYLQ